VVRIVVVIFREQCACALWDVGGGGADGVRRVDFAWERRASKVVSVGGDESFDGIGDGSRAVVYRGQRASGLGGAGHGRRVLGEFFIEAGNGGVPVIAFVACTGAVAFVAPSLRRSRRR
jgi:hypothetical protein